MKQKKIVLLYNYIIIICYNYFSSYAVFFLYFEYLKNIPLKNQEAMLLSCDTKSRKLYHKEEI